MKMLDSAGRRQEAMPYRKYRPFPPIDLPDRTWPGRRLAHAPRWCSVDLRDGNQALVDPMSVDEKLRMYELLLEVGLAEIEVGFPSASKPDFKFIRQIIDSGMVPEDVTIQVLCQARPELIRKTIEAMDGAKSAIFHLYNSTSELQRRVVFRMDQAEIIDLAVAGVERVKEGLAQLSDTHVTLEYSPESFTATELDFAVEICDAVAACWGATPSEKMIVNLPSTVEISTPNVYADQIEYFCRNFRYRDSAWISLHTHNDRGTGVAATEFGLMAGADRVEGTLFGNGERTGNCDLVTVAMNLFSQGVDPELDLRDMPRIRETVETINKIPVHVRHPYAGDLVFTAFSGSHQDAIRKGMGALPEDRWEVPYLPIDPSDVGSSYRESVRVNSQSGKGGVGFILEEYFGISLHGQMLSEFSKVIQELTERRGREVRAPELFETLCEHYCRDRDPYELISHEVEGVEANQYFECSAVVSESGRELRVKGLGETPASAFANALSKKLNEQIQICDRAVTDVQGFMHAVFAEGAIAVVSLGFGDGTWIGLGKSHETFGAELRAIISAMNRRWQAAS